MSFEAEVIPLFIGGCVAVSLLELAAGWAMLRKRRSVWRFFLGHVISMAVGLFFLVKCIFGNRLGLTGPIASIDHSVSIGLFGLCWFVSVLSLLAAFDRTMDDGRKMRP